MLQKPIDPIDFWYQNAGKHLVSADVVAELGETPPKCEIIDQTLAVSFPRSSSKPTRLVEFEAALIGEGWGYIFSKSLAPDTTSAMHMDGCPLVHKHHTLTAAGLLLEVMKRRPEPPFLALAFLKATGYEKASTICVTETLDQLQICTVKDRIIFSRHVLDEIIPLVDRFGDKVVAAAARVRRAREFNQSNYEKERAALEKKLISKEADIPVDELVNLTPLSSSGEATALRLMLSNMIKEAK